jgi:hypothetical protein
MVKAPFFASFKNNKLTFSKPMAEGLYELEFYWNAESSSYPGNYFGVDFGSDVNLSEMSQSFSIFVQADNTATPTVTLERVGDEMGDLGEV